MVARDKANGQPTFGRRVLPAGLAGMVVGMMALGCSRKQETPEVVVAPAIDQTLAGPILNQFEQETGIEAGMLINFGNPRSKFQRLTGHAKHEGRIAA